MNTDIHKQRRNLLGISLGLIIFQVSSGETGPISFLGDGVKLTDGKAIIILAYIALAYSLWRYWLYAKPLHQEFRKLVQERITDSKSLQNFVTPRIEAFKNEAGIITKENFDAAFTDPNDQEEQIPPPITTSFKHKLFTHTLVISVENTKGEFHPDQVIHKIPYITYESIIFKAWLSIMAADKTFSDLFIPYALCYLAIIAAIFRGLYA